MLISQFVQPQRIVLGLMLAIVTSFALAAAPDEPKNQIHWRAGLSSSAQPNQAWLARAKEAGYEMVVNLAPPKSSGSIELEGAIVAGQGLVYVNIPVNFSAPTQRDFEIFSAVLKAGAERRILVHCQVNMRGSSFVLLYRAIHEQANVEELTGKLKTVWVPDGVWHDFIVSTLKQYGKDADSF